MIFTCEQILKKVSEKASLKPIKESMLEKYITQKAQLTHEKELCASDGEPEKAIAYNSKIADVDDSITILEQYLKTFNPYAIGISDADIIASWEKAYPEYAKSIDAKIKKVKKLKAELDDAFLDYAKEYNNCLGAQLTFSKCLSYVKDNYYPDDSLKALPHIEPKEIFNTLMEYNNSEKYDCIRGVLNSNRYNPDLK